MFRRSRLLAIVAAALPMLFAGAGSALSAECIGVQVPDGVKVGDKDLVLNGLGIRKATIFKVKVYVAGLYLSEKSGDGDKIIGSNEPWELALHFVHDADASDIRDAFDEGFKKAAGDSLSALSARIDALKSQMVDFEEGHVLSYAYDPASGTVVKVNGNSGPAIEGADFAAALLKISIGPEPPNEDLKTGLLGGKCE